MEDLLVISENSLALLAKAEIDVQISTAKAFPRSLKNFMDKATSMATLSIDIAESCNYALPRSGKPITGPSIRLAEIVASSYGNIRYGGRIISTDDKIVTAQGICHDLESNTCATVEVKRRITDKYGKRYSDDMITVTSNAAIAIAVRNAIFKVIPSALIDPIYQEALKVSLGTVETLPARRSKAVKYFTDMSVKEQQICDALEVKRIEDIDLEKMHVLRGMANAVKNGETTLKDLFEPKAEEVKKAPEFDRAIQMLSECKSVEQVNDLRAQVKSHYFGVEGAANWEKMVSETLRSLK